MKLTLQPTELSEAQLAYLNALEAFDEIDNDPETVSAAVAELDRLWDALTEPEQFEIDSHREQRIERERLLRVLALRMRQLPMRPFRGIGSAGWIELPTKRGDEPKAIFDDNTWRRASQRRLLTVLLARAEQRKPRGGHPRTLCLAELEAAFSPAEQALSPPPAAPQSGRPL